MMLLEAKPATARARISSESAPSLSSDPTSNKCASKPACLSVSTNGGGDPFERHLTVTRLVERLTRALSTPASAPTGRTVAPRRRLLGLQAVLRRLSRAHPAHVMRTPLPNRNNSSEKLQMSCAELSDAWFDMRASFHAPAPGTRRSFPKGRLQCRKKSAQA